MASPYYDEDVIVRMLSAPVELATTDVIQHAAAQALCDLYDRKATRLEFTIGAAACLALFAEIARLRFVHVCIDSFRENDGSLNMGTLETAREGITQLVKVQRDAVIVMVRRLQQCSEDEDPIN